METEVRAVDVINGTETTRSVAADGSFAARLDFADDGRPDEPLTVRVTVETLGKTGGWKHGKTVEVDRDAPADIPGTAAGRVRLVLDPSRPSGIVGATITTED